MSDSSLSEEFEATVSDREDLEELWEKVDSFAGTLADTFEGDVRIGFTVTPIIEEDDD